MSVGGHCDVLRREIAKVLLLRLMLEDEMCARVSVNLSRRGRSSSESAPSKGKREKGDTKTHEACSSGDAALHLPTARPREVHPGTARRAVVPSTTGLAHVREHPLRRTRVGSVRVCERQPVERRVGCGEVGRSRWGRRAVGV